MAVRALLLTCLSALSLHSVLAGTLNPVVFIPGYTGSELEVRYALKRGTPAWTACACDTNRTLCTTSGAWKTIWWSDEEFWRPEIGACWLAKMTQRRTPAGRYVNSPGVEIRPKDFGGTREEYTLFGALSAKLGYRPGADMFYAPFDWRNGEEGLKQLGHYANLRALVERAYTRNGRRPVVLLSHSMGNHVALSFLHQQTQAWRTKFVRRWVLAAPDFGGDLDSLGGWVGGYGPLDPASNQAYTLTSPAAGLAWLSAYSAAFSEPLVYTDTKNYTANDIEQLLRDMGRPAVKMLLLQADIYASNHDLQKYVKPLPGLEVFSFFGNGHPTLSAFYTPSIKKREVMKVTPIMADGDNDVTLPSLMLSLRVVANTSRVFLLPGVDHPAVIGQGQAGNELGMTALLALVAGDTAPIDKYSLARSSSKSA